MDHQEKKKNSTSFLLFSFLSVLVNKRNSNSTSFHGEKSMKNKSSEFFVKSILAKNILLKISERKRN